MISAVGAVDRQRDARGETGGLREQEFDGGRHLVAGAGRPPG
jgi:hypothetical protein